MFWGRGGERGLVLRAFCVCHSPFTIQVLQCVKESGVYTVLCGRGRQAGRQATTLAPPPYGVPPIPLPSDGPHAAGGRDTLFVSPHGPQPLPTGYSEPPDVLVMGFDSRVVNQTCSNLWPLSCMQWPGVNLRDLREDTDPRYMAVRRAGLIAPPAHKSWAT